MRVIPLLLLLLLAGCSSSTKPDNEPAGVHATLESWRVPAGQPGHAVTRNGVISVTGAVPCTRMEIASFEIQEAEMTVVLALDALPIPTTTRAFELEIHGLEPGLYWLTLEARRPNGSTLTLFYNLIPLDDSWSSD